MPDEPRQRVERAGGKSRRARLTPAPGSDPSPEQPATTGTEAGEPPEPTSQRGRPSPDDERITRERPPHW
ncbi:hypothetical protein J2X63_002585 [Agromyces sp. 3263]|nr:hypothetical protein [Agromyces sp. 3263]